MFTHKIITHFNFPVNVIGDVHQKFDKYFSLIKLLKGNSIQVGDFGFEQEYEMLMTKVDTHYHKVNFGNHDDYTFLNEKFSLLNFSWFENLKIMTIRGAMSVDRHLRNEGIDFWSNEEMSYSEMQEAIDFYIMKKPDIVISHDCPNSVIEKLFQKKDKKTLTSSGLQIMLEHHKPKLWIFGHHHRSRNRMIKNTRFICLKELEVLELNGVE